MTVSPSLDRAASFVGTGCVPRLSLLPGTGCSDHLLIGGSGLPFERLSDLSEAVVSVCRMSTDDPEAPVHHAIDYIEIGVDDVAAAKAFYAAAFGWQFTDYGPGYAGIRRARRQWASRAG